MDKEKLIEIIQAGDTIVNELSKDKAYIIQVEIGDGMSREHVFNFLKNLSEKIRELGLEKFVITPTHKGENSLKFFEIKEDKLVEVE